MNSQDKADLKKYQELKTQRNNASKKYNLLHAEEIKTRRALKNKVKQVMESKDLLPSLVKIKPIKPVKEPIKPVSKPVIDNVDYKNILFTKPKKIKPIKMQKKMQKDDLIFI